MRKHFTAAPNYALVAPNYVSKPPITIRRGVRIGLVEHRQWETGRLHMCCRNPHHDYALVALMAAKKSIASAIVGHSGVGANPANAGDRTLSASFGRAVDG
jgi:hypothetical protein